MLHNRISSARGYVERFGVDAIVFFDLSNIRYLAGFTGSDGVLILGKDSGRFLTDSRYVTQAAAEVTAFDVVEYRVKLEGLGDELKRINAIKVGFEAEHTTVAQLTALGKLLPEADLIPVGAELDDLRLKKDDVEVEQLAGTARISSQAFFSIIDRIRPGATEREVALALEFAMKMAGADEKAFDFIVASGTRGALPHGKASAKVISPGELITIDYGAVCQGYHSDETVTVALGPPDERQREVYSVVKDAHDLALESVRPGVTFKELDRIARRYIDNKGYGSFFGHGLGHGVGLDVHERPVISPRGDGVVEEGMVFTIEPGIYIPGWGGVRIEDTVVVTATGSRTLTTVPKELMII